MENQKKIDIFNNSEIPPYIYNITIAGIVLLSISFFTALTLNLAYDYGNNLKTLKTSKGQEALGLVTAVFSVLGFLLSCTVFHGYNLKKKNDPKSVVTGPINVIQFPHAGTDVVLNSTESPFIGEYLSNRINNKKSNLNSKYL